MCERREGKKRENDGEERDQSREEKRKKKEREEIKERRGKRKKNFIIAFVTVPLFVYAKLFGI